MQTVIVEGRLSGDKLLEPKSFLSINRHSNTTPQDLSEIWNISIEQVKMTLKTTTQRHSRLTIMQLSRRYRKDCMCERKRLRYRISTDTMNPRCRGLHEDRQCQVFGNKQMFAAAYLMPSGPGNDVDQALTEFILDYGAPDSMTMDGSIAQNSRNLAFLVNAQNVKCTFLRKIIFYFIIGTQLLRRFC